MGTRCARRRLRLGGDTAGRLVLLAGEAGVAGPCSCAVLRARTKPERDLWGDSTRSSRCHRSARWPTSPRSPAASCGRDRDGAPPHAVAAALLRELPGRRPAIVVFEDVHWADEATLDVLRLLAEDRDRPGTPRRELPRRRARPHPPAAGLARRALAPRHDRPPPARAAVGRGRCGARRAIRRRSRRAALPDGREPVLRDGGARRRQRRAARHDPRRRTRRRQAAESPARRVLDAAAIVPGTVDLPLLEALPATPWSTSRSACRAPCSVGGRWRGLPAEPRAAS